MEKKMYARPTFEELEIQLNDLCAGSNYNQNTINLKINKIENTRKHGLKLGEGTDGTWDPKF